MKTDFKTLLSSFLPALKRFPYAFGLIIYFLVIGSIQIIFPFSIQEFFRLEVLKQLGFIFLVGTIGIRIAFEQLLAEKDLKLPFKLEPWYDHLASGALGFLLVIFGVLTFITVSTLLVLEIALLWLLVVLFLPFAPFIVRGNKIPEYLLYLLTKIIVLGFFVAFLSSIIPTIISVLLQFVLRIPLGEGLFDLVNLIALFVTYVFGIPYIINQIPIDGNYEKDVKKQHPFFGFFYGTLIPINIFFSLLAAFAFLSFLGEVVDTNNFGDFASLISVIFVAPLLLITHFVLLNTLPLKANRALSNLLHIVVPFVAPVFTVIIISETFRSMIFDFSWLFSSLYLFGLVVAGATAYLTFLYFKNKRVIPVRESYLVFIIALLTLITLLPFTNTTFGFGI
jgi:hypothetical protein